MSGQSNKVPIDKCPECGLPHLLEIIKVEALTSFSPYNPRQVTAVFLCPTHNVLFTLTLEQYDEKEDAGLAI